MAVLPGSVPPIVAVSVSGDSDSHPAEITRRPPWNPPKSGENVVPEPLLIASQNRVLRASGGSRVNDLRLPAHRRRRGIHRDAAIDCWHPRGVVSIRNPSGELTEKFVISHALTWIEAPTTPSAA